MMLYIKFVFFLVIILFANQTLANDLVLDLAPVGSEKIDRCYSLQKGTLPLTLDSIEWQQQEKKLGFVKKKNETIVVSAAQDVSMLIKESIKTTLQHCGFTFSDQEPNIKVNLSVQDFFVKTENDGVVGKGFVNTEIVLSLKPSNRDLNYQITLGKESSIKTSPFAQKKRFEKLLNEALVDMCNELATSKSFYEAISLGSGL
jgi:uncharacterized lipoprotein YajG